MSRYYFPVPDWIDITVIEDQKTYAMIPVEREVWEASEQSRHQDEKIQWGARNTIDPALKQQLALKSLSVSLRDFDAKQTQAEIAKNSKNLMLMST